MLRTLSEAVVTVKHIIEVYSFQEGTKDKDLKHWTDVVEKKWQQSHEEVMVWLRRVLKEHMCCIKYTTISTLEDAQELKV